MESGAVDQSNVDEGARVIETPTPLTGKPLREPAYRLVIRKSQRRPFKPVATIDVDLVGAVDQDIGYSRHREQRLKRARANGVAAELIDEGKDGAIAAQLIFGT